MTNRDQYERYRAVGKELHSKILDAYSDRELILNSADALGLETDGDDIFYDFESDMTVHYEFMIYEYLLDGKTAGERYYEEEKWERDIERTILEATLNADTSLFQIDAINESNRRLEMTDLLSDRGEISVLDMNLSLTGEPGILLFFRPLQYDEFTITSGVSFPFPKDEKDRLRTEYEDRIDPVNSTSQSLQRFTTFYDLFRDYGIQVQYR